MTNFTHITDLAKEAQPPLMIQATHECIRGDADETTCPSDRHAMSHPPCRPTANGSPSACAKSAKPIWRASMPTFAKPSAKRADFSFRPGDSRSRARWSCSSFRVI